MWNAGAGAGAAVSKQQRQLSEAMCLLLRKAQGVLQQFLVSKDRKS